MLTGGCHCGRVRYEAEGKLFHPTLCHCRDCRRVSGAPCVAWFTVSSAGFRITQGVLRHYASSARAERGFCGDCGTPILFQAHDLPQEVDVTTASLDDPEAVPPADHTQVGSRLSWMRLADGLRQFRTSREDG
ncbi:GFA family protein [Muricoccus radiodurans]|uniref:GFA family protein n=1 Tax=Muricoccus radiodurans TaxID=2231721 RepID=UPI003CF0A08F